MAADPRPESPVAVVTGGAGGIGRATSLRLAREGARVLVADLDADAARRCASEIEAAGGAARALACDVREDEAVAQLAAEALAWGEGHVPVLVNNVGDYRPAGLFAESDPGDWEALYAVNLRHVFACTRALLPAMLERGAGSIVNVATVEAFRGIPACSVYAAFKAGVTHFTKSLAVEVGSRGVRVNAVAPDLIDTEQTPYHRWLSEADRKKVPSWVPLARIGRPEDVAEVIAFLASEASRFVTGQTLPVDGGSLSASGWYRKAGRMSWTNRPREI